MVKFAPRPLLALPLALFTLQAVTALWLPPNGTQLAAGLQYGYKGDVVAADLLYLFHRPAEPVFSLRGINRDVAFDVPASYLPARYKAVAAAIRKKAHKASARLIPVPELEMPEDRFADVSSVLPYRSEFARSPPTLACVIRFWHFFRESGSLSELLARAIWARLHFNPEMVLDALLLTLLRSPLQAVQDLQLPELTQYFPDIYVDDVFFARAREEMHEVPEKSRNAVPVVRNLNKDDESVLWYFREDPHFQVLHWKWHYKFPSGTDDLQYVDLPRRGELFTQIHRQFIARYNAERFSNGIPAALPLDLYSPLPTGYFPKMVHLHAAKGLIGRQANTSLLAVPNFIDNYESKLARYEAVLADGSVLYANGTRVALEGIEGLDIIANLLEGNSDLSPNYDFYGNIHNSLHGVVAASVDPLGTYNEPLQLLRFNTMVTKDPAFYNIHTLLDGFYEKYRKTLTPYSAEELTPLSGVTLQSVAVRSEGESEDGLLYTYMQQSDLDVSLGMDYTPAGRQYARFTHLQHRAFDYVLQVQNDGAEEKKVFVRLFLLITRDETGAELDYDTQRRLSIQMDTFEAVLSPGANEVRRASTASALTVDTDAVYTPQPNATAARRRNLCRCGWPQGLLLPRGTAGGTAYRLLAMVTDYEADRAPVSDAEVCHDGWLLCGVPGSSHFPDARAMAFPLDRPYRDDVKSLDDLLTANMATADVVVTFENVTEVPTALLPGGASTSWLPTKRQAQ